MGRRRVSKNIETLDEAIQKYLNDSAEVDKSFKFRRSWEFIEQTNESWTTETEIKKSMDKIEELIREIKTALAESSAKS